MIKLKSLLTEMKPKITRLSGMSNQAARNFISKIANKSHRTGIYNDDYWKGKDEILDAFANNNISYTVVKSEYSPEFPNKWKTWDIEFDFINNREKETILHGKITAAGAGSVEYPLDKYDITFTM